MKFISTTSTTEHVVRVSNLGVFHEEISSSYPNSSLTYYVDEFFSSQSPYSDDYIFSLTFEHFFSEIEKAHYTYHILKLHSND